MARKNRFMDQEMDYVGMLNEESSEDNLTKTIARELENEQNLENEILTAPANMFIPYEDEKLRLDLHHGEDRERLKESIQLNGIFTPVICVKKDDNLMILSGHNRVDIAKELNLEVPYILKSNLTKEELELICIDDNLIHRQRTDYKPMQLAYTIKVKMDAESHQGKSLGTGYSNFTGDKIGKEHGLSRKMINIYLKLNDLTDKIKKMLDNNEIAIKAAYELAFLDSDFQNIIISYFVKRKMSVNKIRELRLAIEKNHELKTVEEKKYFVESKLKEQCVPGTHSYKINFKTIRKYIPKEIKDEKAEEYIINAINFYENNKHENQ